MAPAYSGNSAYCYTNSLHMCLKHAGMRDVPDVNLIECMTGMPFGSKFLKLQSPQYFPSPAVTDPDEGLARALQTMGWTCAVSRFEDADTALAALTSALRNGPVLIGPLDMGHLPYDPVHEYKRGGDHFIVALRIDGDLVQVHDPQFYPFAVLPVAALMQAWNASQIAYSAATYTCRYEFSQQRLVSEERMLADTFKTAQEMVHSPPTGPVNYGGKAAHKLAAEVLRKRPTQEFTAFLTHFSLPLGARRCIDAASFFNRIGNAEAADLMVDKAGAFGRAQYHAVLKDWQHTAECFEHLSRIEAMLARSL